MCVVATKADPLLTAARKALKLMLPEISRTLVELRPLLLLLTGGDGNVEVLLIALEISYLFLMMDNASESDIDDNASNSVTAR